MVDKKMDRRLREAGIAVLKRMNFGRPRLGMSDMTEGFEILRDITRTLDHSMRCNGCHMRSCREHIVCSGTGVYHDEHTASEESAHKNLEERLNAWPRVDISDMEDVGIGL